MDQNHEQFSCPYQGIICHNCDADIGRDYVNFKDGCYFMESFLFYQLNYRLRGYKTWH